MHSWLPDAHAEAPSPISALLSAVLLNCALYALLRFDAITSRAIGSGFSHTLLLIFGALSVVVAGLLMVVQRDLKRLLAYSSIEHMGIVAHRRGTGRRRSGLYGALLHVFNHSVAKSCCSLPPAMCARTSARCAWTAFAAWRARCPGPAARWSRQPGHCRPAALRAVRQRICHSDEAFSQARYAVAVLLLVALSVVFGGLLHHFQRMLAGEPESAPASPSCWPPTLRRWASAPPVLLVLGVHIPGAFTSVLHAAMAVLQ